MLRNLRLDICYDGTRYRGWQRLTGVEGTIQGKLEAVLGTLQGHPVNVIGAGRTDAGVHARAMVANCYLETEMQPEEIRDYMNRYLPDDICVQEAKLAVTLSAAVGFALYVRAMIKAFAANTAFYFTCSTAYAYFL